MGAVFALQFFAEVPKVRKDILQVGLFSFAHVLWVGTLAGRGGGGRGGLGEKTWNLQRREMMNEREGPYEHTILIKSANDAPRFGSLNKDSLTSFLPRVQKVPFIGEYFEREVPPSDNVRFLFLSFFLSLHTHTLTHSHSHTHTHMAPVVPDER